MKVEIKADRINNVINSEIVNLNENVVDCNDKKERIDTDNSKSKLIELLISGDIAKVLNILKDNYSSEKEKSNIIILLAQRYNQLMQDKIIGIISHDEQLRELAKLSDSILKLINE